MTEAAGTIPAGPARPGGTAAAAVRAADPLQVLAGLVFLGLVALVVVVQVRNSLDLAQLLGVQGGREGRRWWALYTAVAAVIAVGAAVLPRRVLWMPVGLGGLALAVALAATATAGAEIWSMVAAVLTLTAALVLGRSALRAPGLRGSGLAASGAASMTAGLGVLGLVVFLVGLAGLIRWWTLGLLLIGAGAWGLVVFVRGERDALRGVSGLWSSRLRAGVAGIVGLQGAYAAIWAGAPEVQYDAVQYKAWLPAHWAYTGQIDADLFRDSPYTVYLGLAQLDATPAHTVGAEDVGRYLQFLILGLLVALAWRLGSRVSPALGAIGALVVATVPQLMWQASTAYDDLFLTMLVVGTALAILHYERRPPEHPLAASAAIGFLAGSCVTGKLHLAPFAAAVPLVWLLVSRGAGDLARRAGGLAAGLVVGALPVLAYRWVITGNPVFPYYNTIFESPYFQSSVPVASFTGDDNPQGLIGTGITPWDWLWTLVSTYPKGIELAAPGVVGLLVPAAAVGFFFGWRGDRARRAAWGAAALALIVWWIQFRYVRFLLPYATLAALLALPMLGAVGRWVRSRVATIVALGIAVVAAGAFIVSVGSSLWNVPGRFPLAAAVGQQPEEEYVRTALPDAAAMWWLNDHAEPGDNVTGRAWGRSLLDPDVGYRRDFEVIAGLELDGTFSRDPEVLRAGLERREIDWIVLTDGTRQFSDDYWLAPVLDEYGEVVYADHLRDVYRLVDEPPTPVPVELCDPTLSTPSCWYGAAVPDEAPGLTPGEVAAQPVGTTVPVAVCPGATYGLVVTAGVGATGWRVYFVFDVADPEQPFRNADVDPESTEVLYQTAPAGATSLDLILQPFAPDAAPITRMALSIVSQPEDGPPCG